ncbi:hemerythrin domain-containing protein [Sphaerisporangium sp. TRM90804]|uniref:hemerythrin domain-containing protein n=1 Tax=Sphaerisporangium sp. TRM90804 TaxID=3031113 RepID=UPI002448EAC0|nr:hemerythrin domain-containing protein [Sphaerisporangium sp. TRM90804]MDH2423904.1 hemerythrin domain-containing protein [Sphaerisporangium sp. TRM90804]
MYQHSGAPNPAGEALVAQLTWVHDMIRRDLRTVSTMAEQVVDGLPPSEVRQGLRSLATNGPLWQLRVNCLQYCNFVHLHHRLESKSLFPALRERNPALGPVVDQLEADHLKVSDQLDEVEAAADGLYRDDSPANRDRLGRGLRALAADLLAHLRYEEEQISGTLRTMTHIPGH